MRVEIEAANTVLLEQCRADLLRVCFEKMEKSRNSKIKELRARMERYEKKRAQEQADYHKMSMFRRLLSARTPDHHLAVEQTVYIKLPMEEIEKLNAEITLLRGSIRQIDEHADSVVISVRFKDELVQLYWKEGEE
ncbi:hypothetical protein [Aneurinibacillus tyrosinisolvens]|uniref:hypothetical protein n=1 Tax=Aneurinibacillus tyrosinisolvens TaxID=1443435 RepID=UPI00069C3092|nr:hypothetical protein [Aneurinibacillus tyrosinisolvens]